MPFTPLGDALHHKISGATPLKKQVQAAMVVDYATEALVEIFGAEQAAHAKPLFLKNRTLTISCATGAIAQEVRLRQQEIVEKVNQKLGKNEVDRIRYLA